MTIDTTHRPLAAIPILVRDIVRHRLHELSPVERMLRVPYDLFNPAGPVLLHDGLITYVQGGQPRTGRTAESKLADSHPGERVLVRFADEEARGDEWWLCEIQRTGWSRADA